MIDDHKKAAPQDSGTAGRDEVSLKTQCKGTENLSIEQTKGGKISIPILDAVRNPESYVKQEPSDDVKAAMEAIEIIDKAWNDSATGYSGGGANDDESAQGYASRMLELYRSTVILPGTEYRRPEALMTCDGRPLFVRGKVSAIKGLAGARKTWLCRLLAGIALADPSGDLITSTAPLRVLYVDTEQGQDRAALSRNIVVSLSGKTDPPLEVASFVNLSRVEALKCFAIGLAQFNPDLALLDGVADIMTDTNDKRESEFIKDVLLKLVNRYDCNICAVIHTNPTGEGKMRGHIGTELHCKVDTELEVKAKEGEEFSIVEVTKSRELKPAPICLYIDQDTGTPKYKLYLKDAVNNKPTAKDEKKAKAYAAVVELLDGMGSTGQANNSQLERTIMKAAGVKDRTAQTYISEFVSGGKLTKFGSLYILPRKQDHRGQEDEDDEELWHNR